MELVSAPLGAIFLGFLGQRGPGPWAHMGQGPWAHGPGPILEIFDFLDFLGLSEEYAFLNFWISDGPF